MRNLKLSHSAHLNHAALSDTQCITTDPDSGIVYAVNSSDQLLQICDSQDIACIDFIIERQIVCIIRSSGDIVSFDPQTKVTEVAAVTPAGVCAVSWSPDQEILLIAQEDHRLVALTQYFEIVSDVNLNPTGKGCAESVNVGWGSKETQFHGSEGKAAARVKQQDTLSLVSGDDRRIRLSWRRDGQLFASSSIDPVKGVRVVRIWNRELELQYTSDVSEGLEHCLCWKPSGEVIAVSQQRFGKHEICFIEKNGLFLSSMRLPFPASSFLISDLSWSSDSTVLAVWGYHITNMIFYLMLWSVNNHHWYLKQTFEFQEKDRRPPQSIAWDPVDPLTLHLVFADGTYSRFKYMWQVCRSSNATVAVIDGMEVLVTPFEKHVVPPPMSVWKVMSREFVNDVSFDSDSNLIIYTKSSSIIYTRKKETSLSQHLNETGAPLSVALTEAVNPRANILRPAFWIDAHPPDELCRLSLLVGIRDGYVAVSCGERPGTKNSLICWCPGKYFKLDLSSVVIAMAFDPCSQRIAVEFAEGTVVSFDSESGTTSTWTDCEGREVHFPQPCRVLQTSSGDLFGLSDNFSLYRNNDLLLRTCCTSFLIHQNSFLVYTTTSHALMLTCLRTGEDMLLKEAANEEERKQQQHPIERGSKLVTTTSSSAIMQTPRGNLELVSPRPFLWLTIDSLMQDRAFLSVFHIMRKHRINFHLLIDRHPELFRNSIEAFVDEVSNESMEHLVLFLTSLSEKVYQHPVRIDGETNLDPPEDHNRNHASTKDAEISRICTRIRDILIDKHDDRFLHPILLTLVIAGQVEEALLRVKHVCDDECRDKALSFLLYFVSVNDLFNEAIGSYDFDVVRMVAQKSQKDPKEYLKMIQQLQSYEPEYYMKFKIDVSLGRFVSALKHVTHCDDESIMAEVLDLVQSRKLFKDAVTWLQNDELRKKVWHKYADYLLSKKYYSESAIAYKRSGNRISAIRCHQLSGNWNQAISESLLLRDPHQLRTLCLSLIESLKSSGRRIEAALIADKYLSDADSAVRILIEGCEWDAASRLMAQTPVSEQEQLFRQSLHNEAERLTSSIGVEKESLTRYVTRLLHIRKEKENQVEEQERFSDDAMSDVSSVRSVSRRSGSSGKSLLTRASGTSSSARRRDVRKWAKLKEGSRFEDVAIVVACQETIVRIDKMQSDVSSLLRHLMENEFVHAAQTCGRAFRELVQTAKSSIQSVWIDNLSTTFRMDQSDLTPDFDELISKPKISDVKWDLLFL